MKACTRCGEVKPGDQFHRNKRKVDGLDANCKACNNARMRAKYASDATWREAKIAATTKYHRDNPEWSKERLRESHVRNRDERYRRAVERGADPNVRQKRRDSTRRSEQRRRAIKAASEVVESISASDLAAHAEAWGASAGSAASTSTTPPCTGTTSNRSPTVVSTRWRTFVQRATSATFARALCGR